MNDQTSYHFIYLCVKYVFNARYLCTKCSNLWMNKLCTISSIKSSNAIFVMIFFYTLPSNSNKIPSQINPPCLTCVITTLLCCQQHYFVVMVDHMILSTYTTSCHSLKEKNIIFFSNALHPHLSHPYTNNHFPQCIVSK
jgi:hypothetical protein